jgi:hypothetical protein
MVNDDFRDWHDDDLRALVDAWSPRDAGADRRARLAYRELQLRHEVELDLARRYRQVVSPPAPLPTPPWDRVPPPATWGQWRRPRGSRCYPE